MLSLAMCALLLCSLFFGTAASAAMYDESKINSQYAAVYNVENGTFLFQKGGDEKISSSNTAKIMTAVLALEHYKNLDEVITVPLASIQNLEGATIFGLLSGEQITVRDLIYTMLVGNCNDCASVLACDIAGTNALFALEMNDKAKEIGLEKTFFKNSTGIGATDAYTTVKDALLLCSYALSVDGFSEIANTTKYTVSATNKHSEKTVYTKNYFLSRQTYSDYYWQEANGISALNADEGYTVISSYTAYSMTYICICAGAGKSDAGKILAYSDVKNLLRWASTEYTTLKVLDSSQIFGEIPVTLSKEKNYVSVVPETSLYAYLPHDTDVSSEVEIKYEITEKELSAPVEIGTKVGNVSLYMDGEEIASCALVTKFSAERSGMLAFKATLFSGKTFAVISVFALIACVYGVIRFLVFLEISKKGSSE